MIRVVIVDALRRSTLIHMQGEKVEVHLYATKQDDIYADLAKLTARAMEVYHDYCTRNRGPVH